MVLLRLPQLVGLASLLVSSPSSAEEACRGTEIHTYERTEDGGLVSVSVRCLGPDEQLPWYDAPLRSSIHLRTGPPGSVSGFRSEDLEGGETEEPQWIELIPGLDLLPQP